MSSLRYAVRIETPARHTAEVTLRFTPTGDTTDITLPAWCPGSYLIRDYARFVRDLVARGDDGAHRPATKIDKSTWRIDSSGVRELTVRYALYGHDLTVRTNHVDGTHAFLHGPATFLYPTTHRTAPVEVELAVPDGWTVTTAMAWDARPVLTAANIDELYDHPIHAGVTRTLRVPAKVPVRLVVWGDRAPGGVFTESRLAEDLGAIADDHIARMG